MQKTLANQPLSGDNSGAIDGAINTIESPLTTPRDEGAEMADSDSTTGKSPAFQFYPNDFLSDANVIVMSMQERGVYITLICVCWQQGSLPIATERLAPICGLPTSLFRKLWPAVEPCFRKHANGDRYVHPRLERERRKQRAYRKSQSDKGKLGGRPKKPELFTEKATAFENESQAPENLKAEKRSSSSYFDLQSSDSSQKTAPPSIADARSKRPIFKGTQFVVFEWMLDDLRRMLGRHFEDFDVHAWFFDLDERARSAGLVVPQRDGGQWLQAETLAEAVRRGLPVAATAGVGKTAGNPAAAARFIARGAQ